MRLLGDLQTNSIRRDLAAALAGFRGHLLDVGCGNSPFRHLLDPAATQYQGVDVEAAAAFGYKNPDTVYYDGNVLPFPDASFDVVLCTEVLEHIAEPAGTIREMHRVLKPGGLLLLTIPWSARFHYQPFDYHPLHAQHAGAALRRFRHAGSPAPRHRSQQHRLESGRGLRAQYPCAEAIGPGRLDRVAVPPGRRHLRLPPAPAGAAPRPCRYPLGFRLRRRSAGLHGNRTQIVLPWPTSSTNVATTRSSPPAPRRRCASAAARRRSSTRCPPPTGSEPRRILELGCGMGELAHDLATITDAHVVGVDLSEKFIHAARATHRRPNLEFIVADLTRENPAAGQARYDAITGNGILHHLYHHLDAVLPALHRWLRPGGRLIFWEPNLWNPYVWTIFTIPPMRRAAKLEPDEMAFTPGLHPAQARPRRLHRYPCHHAGFSAAQHTRCADQARRSGEQPAGSHPGGEPAGPVHFLLRRETGGISAVADFRRRVVSGRESDGRDSPAPTLSLPFPRPPQEFRSLPASDDFIPRIFPFRPALRGGPMKGRDFWRAILVAVALLGGVLWLRWATFGGNLWNVDEAIHAAAARTILDGGVLYRDACDIRNPLTYYVVAGVFVLCGENNLWAVRCLVALLITATAIFLYFSGCALRRPGAGAAAAGLYAALSTAVLFPRRRLCRQHRVVRRVLLQRGLPRVSDGWPCAVRKTAFPPPARSWRAPFSPSSRPFWRQPRRLACCSTSAGSKNNRPATWYRNCWRSSPAGARAWR